MNRLIATIIFILSAPVLACLPGTEMVEYVPLKKVGEKYVEAPELLTETHIAKAKTVLYQCMVENGSIYLSEDGVLSITKNISVNRSCIASVTEQVEAKEKIELPLPKIKPNISVPNV
ncbi:hypothetical protein R50072_37080 [Simiduia litorea]|uniref:hypothetical protein n=1 Tax=Simiduia litorea TaxID=1435348 RepID=UPI0036F44933